MARKTSKKTSSNVDVPAQIVVAKLIEMHQALTALGLEREATQVQRLGETVGRIASRVEATLERNAKRAAREEKAQARAAARLEKLRAQVAKLEKQLG